LFCKALQNKGKDDQGYYDWEGGKRDVPPSHV
jgi:hypothetical protein